MRFFSGINTWIHLARFLPLVANGHQLLAQLMNTNVAKTRRRFSRKAGLMKEKHLISSVFSEHFTDHKATPNVKKLLNSDSPALFLHPTQLPCV